LRLTQTTGLEARQALLEQRFGLVDTTRDPLAAAPTSDLQTWRLEYLQSRWKKQDWAADARRTPRRS
jgi:hypothetical protein